MLAISGVSRKVNVNAARKVDEILKMTGNIQSGLEPPALEVACTTDLDRLDCPQGKMKPHHRRSVGPAVVFERPIGLTAWIHPHANNSVAMQGDKLPAALELQGYKMFGRLPSECEERQDCVARRRAVPVSEIGQHCLDGFMIGLHVTQNGSKVRQSASGPLFYATAITHTVANELRILANTIRSER